MQLGGVGVGGVTVVVTGGNWVGAVTSGPPSPPHSGHQGSHGLK